MSPNCMTETMQVIAIFGLSIGVVLARLAWLKWRHRK